MEAQKSADHWVNVSAPPQKKKLSDYFFKSASEIFLSLYFFKNLFSH